MIYTILPLQNEHILQPTSLSYSIFSATIPVIKAVTWLTYVLFMQCYHWQWIYSSKSVSKLFKLHCYYESNMYLYGCICAFNQQKLQTYRDFLFYFCKYCIFTCINMHQLYKWYKRYHLTLMTLLHK